jgi:hypothetical protein
LSICSPRVSCGVAPSPITSAAVLSLSSCMVILKNSKLLFFWPFAHLASLLLSPEYWAPGAWPATGLSDVVEAAPARVSRLGPND